MATTVMRAYASASCPRLIDDRDAVMSCTSDSGESVSATSEIESQMERRRARAAVKGLKHNQDDSIHKSRLFNSEVLLQPGVIFVPWGPLGPPDRSQSVSEGTWDTQVDNHVDNSAIEQPHTGRDQLVQLAQSKLISQRRSRKILFISSIMFILLTAVSVGVWLGTRKSSLVTHSITVMELPTQSCAYWFDKKQPNVVTQCTCSGSISVVAKDIQARYYNLISESSLSNMLSNFNSVLDSCEPVNQALIWLASGSGLPASTSRIRQRYVLALLFISWNIQRWNSGEHWLSPEDECTWIGVSCNEQGDVVAIFLPNRGLNGPLGSDFALLTSLTSLSLVNNALQGNLPTQIGELTKLTAVRLENNQLNGTLPSELGMLSLLVDLSISVNRIHGMLPTQVGHLYNLDTIDLSNNTLTGQIPTETGMLKAKTISFSFNNFSSSIPSEIGLSSHLQQFLLVSAGIHGSIPDEIFNLGNSLIALRLELNSLSGTISTLVGKLSKLASFAAAENKLTGTIPAELGDCTVLAYLDLSFNKLHGKIPTELTRLSDLAWLSLKGNQLTGTVPKEMCQLNVLDVCKTSLLQCNCCSCLPY